MTNADIIPRESLMDRARLRLANNPNCVVELDPYTGRRTWQVEPDLDDQMASYLVTWTNSLNKYRCTCWARTTPNRKICSHMLAVVLWRKSNGSSTEQSGSVLSTTVPEKAAATTVDLNVVDGVSPGTSTTATEGVQVQSASVPEDDPPSSEREVGSVPFTAPPSDALTLMDFNLPSWVKEVRPHQWDAVNECVELFKAGKKVVWLDAPTGCLTGDTMIGINQRGKGRKIRLDDLVHRFNSGEYKFGRGLSRTGSWNPETVTKVQVRIDGVVRLAVLTDAIDSGVKTVYELTTRDGRSIKGSSNHPFWTQYGWTELGSIQPGDAVAVDVGRKTGENVQGKKWYRLVNNLRHHPYAGRRGVANSHNDGWSVGYHRLVVEARESGVSTVEFIERCRSGDIHGLVFLDPSEWVVHHKNEDHTDNSSENLEKLTPEVHFKHHAHAGNVLHQIGWDEVISVVEIGEEHTYDLTVDGVGEFIANEFVVHNSGKTLIAEMVRQVLNKPAVYVCSGKELQDQFARDFDYSKVLKGRSNYATQVGGSEISAADCTSGGWDDPCAFCPDKAACGYTVAKNAALRSDIAVLNTTYLLTEANGPGRFSGRGLGILDECDVVESELMSYVEFYVGDRALKELKVVAPKKGSHYKTIMAWIKDELLPAAELRLADLKSQGKLFIAGGEDVKHERKVKAASRLVADIHSVLANHRTDNSENSPGDNWVRDNNDALRLKAVSVAEYGPRMLWRHCDQWLCMSATIISPELMAESLGLGVEDWGVVRVPMTFPVENRPIYQIPVVSMTYKDRETAWPEMVEGIVKVVGQSKHDGERVLIHGVSYALCKEIVSGLQRAGLRDGSTGQQRRILTYKTAWERANCLVDFRASNGAVLVAPSMDRGVDFKNDDCRVVILPKVPAPSLGDPQVSKKMHGVSGQLWYDVQIIRSIVQMTGRGVRSADDWCVTYILDSQFGTNVFKKRKRLFPSWWRDAVVFMRLRDLE